MKKSMIILFIVMFASLYIASMWDKYPVIKETVGSVLNPSLGVILKWNVYIGFLFVIALISFILTLAQKYLSNQAALKELRSEQKLLQEEMKKYKDHPEKLLEFQKKQLEFIPKTFDLTLKPMMYTTIPIILLFRWFGDYLKPIFGNWWILYYIIGAMVFSTIFRKALDVA